MQLSKIKPGFLILLACLLAGCEMLSTPAPVVIENTPTVAPTRVRKPKPATATAGIFVLRDTSTPFPSRDAF